ncbi:MAG: hypothetical protein ABFS17_06965 [Chloroflexota bacterium]
MAHVSKLFRIVGILIIAAVGIWTLSGSVTPGVETAAHQEAVRAAAYGQAESVSPSEGSAGGTVESVMINLAEVDNSKPIDSMYERWQRGELDLDEMEYRVGRAEREALQESARNMAPGTGAQEDSLAPDQNAPTLLNSFDGPDVGDCCGGSGTSVPPDSDIAAGPDFLIAVENSSFTIYNKAGVKLYDPILFDNFFSAKFPQCTGLFDPTVMYDSEADRFVLAVENGEDFCLMVTAFSGNPLVWWGYTFDARYYGDEFFDYPHIGIGDSAIFMGANMFGGSVPGDYEGRIYAMDKNAAYAGNPMGWRTFSTGYFGGTPQPLNLTGFTQGTVPQPFSTHFFITDRYDGTTADLWAWPNALGSGTPSIVQTYDLDAEYGYATGFPLDALQKDSTDLIETNDWRFRGFEYRNGYGWTADTVSYNFGSGTRDIIRWTKIDLETPGYPIADGNIWGNSMSNYIFPDLAVDHCGNMALGFEQSDGTRYPSIRYSGRLASDPPGIQSSASLKIGEASYYSFDGSPLRWGDYSGMAADPDGRTFWYMGEYAKDIPLPNPQQANYGNYIAKITYNCIVPKRPSGKITDRTPKFAWTKALGADLYQIQLFRAGVFFSNEYATDGYCGPTYCGKTPGVTLTYDDFTWKVRARIGGVWKDWSPLEAFKVTYVPVPKSPSGDTFDTTPQYSWLKKPGAALYHYQLYKADGTFVYNQFATDGYCGAEYCGKTPATALGGFSYKWKVRAQTGGVWGPWSSFEHFKVYP